MSLLYAVILQGHQVSSAASEAEGGGGATESAPHLTNIVAILSSYFGNIAHNLPVADFLSNWVNVIYSWAIMLILVFVFARFAARMKKVPGRSQSFVELLFDGLDRFVQDVLGPEGRTYVPLVGTLFIYILVMNLAGIIPIFGHSPSSSLNVTASMAISVFLIVQVHGIRALGLLGYLKHFAGISEKPHIVEFILAPLMLLLHIVGELAKPVSLSLRLFGNITGEDVLLAVFVMLAARYLIPLQVMVYPIILLSSFIQALVFALLTTVYLLLMSPHKEEH